MSPPATERDLWGGGDWSTPLCPHVLWTCGQSDRDADNLETLSAPFPQSVQLSSSRLSPLHSISSLYEGAWIGPLPY